MRRQRRWHAVTLLACIVACAIVAPVAVEAVEERPVHPPAPTPRPDLSDIEATQLEIEKALREHLSVQAMVDSVLVGLEALEVGIPLPPDPAPINAVEITIDPLGGITLQDRDGKTYHQFAGIPIPPLPRGLGTTRLEDYREVTHGDVVHIGSNIVVEEDVLVDGSVTCIFCDVTIHGEVTGAVVSAFGSIKVDGSIGRDALAPFGLVHVKSSGRVGGDVVGSQIQKEPGGRIGGMRSQILFEVFGSEWESISRYWTQTTLTVLVVLKVVFWLFLALLAHALACKNIVRVKRKIAASPIKSFFVGFAVQILFLPVLLILIVTIVGIPVAVFLVPLLIVVGLVLAYAAAGLLLGEKIDRN
ncbi:MAG TPA: polymer-forming cytoskeletal protein, partial [Acidobacteriota bacterium]|nr:polymer-forming cytoskeletal protein [Acidobacteriota bacterium]